MNVILQVIKIIIKAIILFIYLINKTGKTAATLSIINGVWCNGFGSDSSIWLSLRIVYVHLIDNYLYFFRRNRHYSVVLLDAAILNTHFCLACNTVLSCFNIHPDFPTRSLPTREKPFTPQAGEDTDEKLD